MNIEILEKLMEEQKIKSYYQLAKKTEIPYTSLLDLVHGRSNNLYTIKLLANYFKVKITLLIEPTKQHQIILENGTIKEPIFLESLSETNAMIRLLLQEQFD